MSGGALPNPVRFGAFEIDRDAGQLTRSGRRVHLAPQALRLLLQLIDKRGALVTREEIRSALWSDETFVDVDAAVNACISQIRTALGDKPTSPRFVETIPRRGYRFIAPLNDAPSSQPDVASTTGPSPRGVVPAFTGSPSPFRVGLAAVLTVLVLGLVGLALRAGPGSRARKDAPAYARTRSLQAIQQLERGRSGLPDASPAELQARVQFFEAALEIEPDFPEAYAASPTPS
jgi:DNA-binding winged helix-turn-helix (wHTH) protein